MRLPFQRCISEPAGTTFSRKHLLNRALEIARRSIDLKFKDLEVSGFYSMHVALNLGALIIARSIR